MTEEVSAPGAWSPPQPRELPQLRAELEEYTRTNYCIYGLMQSINQGNTTLLPTVEGMEHTSLGAVAGPLLALGEAQRLTKATLFYATADMTSLAVAAAKTPPKEPFSARRLPSEWGFMVFEEPIGGYRTTLDEAVDGLGVVDLEPVAIDTPVVAVSWGPWTPQQIGISDMPDKQIQWVALQSCEDDLNERTAMLVPEDFAGVWITFYTSPRGQYDALPPETVVGYAGDEPVTAGELARGTVAAGLPQLSWDNEYIVRFDQDLCRPAVPDTTTEWLHVVYTAWQLMTQQTKKPLVETEEVPAPRALRRRQEKLGNPPPGNVQVVRLHSNHQPKGEDRDADAARSSGRRAPNYTCRWPVRPWRRWACLDTRKHKDGGCRHEEQVFPASVRGPKDKPLRVPSKVVLWDSQPDDER